MLGKIFNKLSKKDRRIEEIYEFGDQIGKGAFSVVSVASHRETNERVAVKAISKHHVSQSDMKRLTREIDIMKKLKHKNIIQLIDVFETPEYMYIVMEWVRGGELFDKIVERGQYSERDARNLVRQIVSAVDYMHVHGVCHRDLKPENLLCSADDEPEQFVRIADFGLSKIFDGGEELKTACGTPDYVAPEILECKPYDMNVDMWSVGVITYILLCGFTPFYAETHHELFQKIMDLDYDFPEPEWSTVSDLAKDFIRKLLVLNPQERFTAGQAANHPWLTMEVGPAAPTLGVQSKMKDYYKTRKSSSSNSLPNINGLQLATS